MTTNLNFDQQIRALQQQQAEDLAKRNAEEAAKEVSANEVKKLLTNLVKAGTKIGVIPERVMTEFLKRSDDSDFFVLATARTFITNALYGVQRQPQGYLFKTTVYTDLRKLETALTAAMGVFTLPGQDSFLYLLNEHLSGNIVGNAELRRLLLPVEDLYNGGKLTTDDMAFVVGLGGVF